jgi:hypothetical protein
VQQLDCTTTLLILDLPPLQGASLWVAVPRVETLGFYEAADFVKTRCEIISFILIHFGRHLTTPHLFGFGA